MRQITSIFLVVIVTLSNLGTRPASANTEWDNLDAIKTAELAFAEVNTFLESLPNTSVTPKIHLSEDAAKREYRFYLENLDRSSKLWGQFVNPSKLDVVLFTENDGDWVDKKQAELLGSWFSKSERQSERLKKYGCNIGGMYLPGVLFFCVRENISQLDELNLYGEAHKLPHEYTHFMEMNVKDWIGHATGQGIGTRNTCWIEEGFATFYGLAVGSYPARYTPSMNLEFRRSHTYAYDERRGQKQGSLAEEIANGDSALFRNLMGQLENTPFPCDETQNAYAFGGAAAEMLVAVKGQKAMNNFYSDSAKTGDWRSSFERAFGISVPIFYEKLSKYVASQFRIKNINPTTPTPSATPTPIATPSATPTPIATPSATPTTTAIPSTPTIKIVKIICVKGKKIKKIKDIEPKCPKGYKKK